MPTSYKLIVHYVMLIQTHHLEKKLDEWQQQQKKKTHWTVCMLMPNFIKKSDLKVTKPHLYNFWTLLENNMQKSFI